MSRETLETRRPTLARPPGIGASCLEHKLRSLAVQTCELDFGQISVQDLLAAADRFFENEPFVANDSDVPTCLDKGLLTRRRETNPVRTTFAYICFAEVYDMIFT